MLSKKFAVEYGCSLIEWWEFDSPLRTKERKYNAQNIYNDSISCNEQQFLSPGAVLQCSFHRETVHAGCAFHEGSVNSSCGFESRLGDKGSSTILV